MPLVDLDRFDFLYANRVKGMKTAATRDLMATLSRPGIISLAGGFPDTRAFGEEAFREISRTIAEDAAQALQYGPTGGLEAIKDVIVDVMAAEGTPASQESVFVTTGAQQALDLVAKVFLDEGDAILCEGPTYAGALNAFAAYRPRIAHVPMDRAGIIPSAVRETLKRARKGGMHVKFVYTVPNFQNPAGVTLVRERRRELLEIAREYDLIIVEDNPYGMLRFEGEPLPTLAALEIEEEGDVERVVYLGTFSKIFAPGVRLGWVHAQPGILHKINVGKQGADLCSSNLSQMMISTYFQSADWRAYVRRLTGMYKERRDAMLDSLAEFMPREVHWTHPEGGLFVWATLPSYLDATAMLPRAIAKNVAYVPGEGFYAGSEAGKNHMRLNFSFVEPERIRRGIEMLSEVIRERMELRSDLERGSQLGHDSRRGTRPAVGTDR